MTVYWRSVLAALLGSALAACAQVTPPESAQPKAAGEAQVVAARQDLPQRFIGLIGTRAQHAPLFLGVPETNFYCLRSFIDRRTGETAHQLYVTDSYFGAERGWNGARDGAGTPLPFIAIGHDEISCNAGCSYVEEFAAKLSDNALRISPTGLTVAFSSRSGDEKTIVVPAERVTAQLAAIDARRNSTQPVAAFSPTPP